MERAQNSPSRLDGTSLPPQRRRHPALRIVLVLVVLIIVLIAVVPFFVNANAFRPQIQDRLSSALGRRVTLGHLSLSFYSGSLEADNIAIADDPAFSSSPFIQAKSLHVGVHVWPLIFSHQLEITHLTLDAPAIQLIQAQNGKWNFSSLGGNAPRKQQTQPASLPDLSIGDLRIKDGRATISSLPATGKAVRYSAIDLTARQISFTRSFPYQLSANIPGDGTFHLDGNAGPLARQDASDTPFNATLDIAHFDPVAAGVIEPGKGISMLVNAHAQLASNGKDLTSTGKIQAAHLQLARTGSPAPNPVDVDYNIAQNLDSRTGRVNDIAVHTGGVAAHVTGTYRMTPQAVNLDLHLSAPNLPVDQLQALLPAVGVRLPSGSSLHGGTLTANLNITGPATETTIEGPVEIDNTTLAGFNLGSKIQGLNPLGANGNATSIQKVSTVVHSSPQTTQFSNIDAVVPAIGSATGSGTVSPSGALDFHLNAKLSATSGMGQLATQASKKVGGFLGGLLQSTVGTAQNSGVPLTITGTASSPQIRANIGAMLRK